MQSMVKITILGIQKLKIQESYKSIDIIIAHF